jgi:hypothetical protein
MEQRFGHDFSRVRVHAGTAAEQSALDVHAHAYTVGHDMVFGAGRFAPGTHAGRRLLVHELAHVVQQSGAEGRRVDHSHATRGTSAMAPPVAARRAVTRRIQRQPVQGPEQSAGASGEQTSQNVTCDISQKQFVLEYEGEPAKTRCMDIRTDPEYANLFDANIASAVGYAVEGTTWENVEYDRFNVMLVKYKNGTSEYFMLDDVPNFYYGHTSRILREPTYLKRTNGLVYPIFQGRIYFHEMLTPNMLAYKNGLKYQIKELQDLFTLLQTAGAFASIIGAYGVVQGFKSSLQGFRRIKSPPASVPRPSGRSGTTGGAGAQGGTPAPAATQTTSKPAPAPVAGAGSKPSPQMVRTPTTGRAGSQRASVRAQPEPQTAAPGPWRGRPDIQNGNLREGWTHIEARHITGTHPEGAGDLFAAGTTRAQLQRAATTIVARGTRISDPGRRIQTFERRITINGKSDSVRVVVDTRDGRVITMFPVRGGG